MSVREEGRRVTSADRVFVGRGRLRLGRVGRSREAERQEQRSEPNAITIAQTHGSRDLAIADERPVLAAQIFDPDRVVDFDTCVPSRHSRVPTPPLVRVDSK